MIEDTDCKLVEPADSLIRLDRLARARRAVHGMYAAGPGTSQGSRVSDWTTDAADVIERTRGAGARPDGRARARDRHEAIVYGLLAVLVAFRPSFLLLIGAFRAPRDHRTGRRLGGLAHARRNLRDRRGVLLDQAQSLTTPRATNGHAQP